MIRCNSVCCLRVLGIVLKEPNSDHGNKKYKLLIIIIYLMISKLFLYDPLYASSHALESDYLWSGIKDENSPIPELIKARQVNNLQRKNP